MVSLIARFGLPQLILLPLFLSGCQGDAAEPNFPKGEVAKWEVYGATPGGTHFSPATQITPDNVHLLEKVWEHRSGDMRPQSDEDGVRKTQSALQVTPIVVDETLFYCTPFNRVFALDPETGEEKWVYDAGVDVEVERLYNICRGVSSWRSGKTGFCEDRILMGTMDARLIALDAGTGKPCPDFGEAGHVDVSEGLTEHDPVEYMITSAPAILGDKVITGSMVLDNQRVDSPAGVVRAYDVRTGEELWGWNAVPEGVPDKNPDGTWRSGTANAWAPIAVDPERNMVFLPTGNTTPDYYGGHRGEDLDEFASAVVALDGESGRVIWHYQTVHHDLWDFDLPAQPTLVDLQVDGQTVPAVVQVTKMGMTFALHRETGEPLWQVEERPVPQSGIAEGEYLSPTQPFPTHIPHLVTDPITPDDAWGLFGIDRWMCRRTIEEGMNEGFYTPPSLQGSVMYPSNGGGNNWGSPAIDPETGVMVVFTNDVPRKARLVPREECADSRQPQTGTPYCVETGWLMSPVGLPCTAPPWGTLDAVDLNKGEILWSVPFGTTRDIAPFPMWWFKGLPGFAAVMMTKTGLVFAGVTNDHSIRAVDLATGEELWKGRLPAAANALPMTYQLREDGRQFVVVAAGGHWSALSPPGDYIIAYALPVAD